MTNADPFEIPAILDAKLNATARAEARAKAPITPTALLAGLKQMSQPKPMEKKAMIAIKTNTPATKLPVPPPKGASTAKETKAFHVVPKTKTEAKKAPAKPAPKATKKSDGKPKVTIGSVACAAILAGDDNEKALAKVMKAFPDCSSNVGCMSWYRNKLRRDGKKPPKQSAAAAKAEVKRSPRKARS